MFDLQRFSGSTPTVSVEYDFRPSGRSEKYTKKFSYISGTASDKDIYCVLVALNRLTTNTFVTCRKNSSYDVDQAVHEDDPEFDPVFPPIS